MEMNSLYGSIRTGDGMVYQGGCQLFFEKDFPVRLHLGVIHRCPESSIHGFTQNRPIFDKRP